ncbi:MAG: hypothetical protein JOZ47_05220 [Kutzneria sp.]|nr:hypothetical protein [Kutzneria sp.]
MVFRWHYQDDKGNGLSGPGQAFADQAGAEDWLGAHWRELADAGIDGVVLLDDADVVYGPMSLHAG